MGFPVPVSVCRRVFGNRNWKCSRWRGAVAFRWSRYSDLAWRDGRVGSALGSDRSACGEAVSVGGFDDGSGGDQGGEASVESGGTNAARRAQVGEWPWLAGIGENQCDAVIDGFLMDGATGFPPCQ